MKIEDVIKIVNGKLICGSEKNRQEKEVDFGFASDLMSDVLTLNQENIVLITGLVNNQTIRTAEMADIPCIIFVRNKKVPIEMIEMAKNNNLVLVECENTSFYVSGKLFEAGLKAVY